MAPAPVYLNTTSHLTNGHANGVNGLKKPHSDGFGTRAIHFGSDPNPVTGAVIPSISLSTTYKQEAIGVHKVRPDLYPFFSALSNPFLIRAGLRVFPLR